MKTEELKIGDINRILRSGNYGTPNYSPVYNYKNGQLLQIGRNISNQFTVTEYMLQQKKKGFNTGFGFETLEESWYNGFLNGIDGRQQVNLTMYGLDPNVDVGIRANHIGSNAKGSSHMFRAMEWLNDPNINSEIVVFDTETIGDAHQKNWFITEMSFYKKNAKTGQMESSKFFFRPRENKETNDYITNIMEKAKKNLGSPIDGLTVDERRSLLSLTDITLGTDGKIVSKKIGYDKLTRIDEKILKQAEEGYDILNKYGTSIGDKTSKRQFQKKLAKLFGSQQSKNTKTIIVGQNMFSFDIPGVNNQFGKGFFGGEGRGLLDTLSLARIVHGSNPKLHTYTLDSLAKWYNIPINESKRHLSDYDTELTYEILERLKVDYQKKFGQQQAFMPYSVGSKGDFTQDNFMVKPVRNFYRMHEQDAMYLSSGDGTLTPAFFKPLRDKNGKLKIADDLYSHQILDVNSAYTIDKTFKDGGRWYAQMTNVDTGDVSIFGKNSKEELEAQLDEMFGGFTHKFQLKGDGELIERNFNSMFHSSRGYYNLQTMTNMLNQVEEQLGDKVSNQRIREFLANNGWSNERIQKFMSMHPQLKKNRATLNKILNTVDDLNIGGESLSEIQKSHVLANTMSQYGDIKLDYGKVKLNNGTIIGLNENESARGINSYIRNKVRNSTKSQDFKNAYIDLVGELSDRGVINEKTRNELFGSIDDFYKNTDIKEGSNLSILTGKIANAVSNNDPKNFYVGSRTAYRHGQTSGRVGLHEMAENITKVFAENNMRVLSDPTHILTGTEFAQEFLKVQADAYGKNNDLKTSINMLQGMFGDFGKKGIDSYVTLSNQGDSLEVFLFDKKHSGNIISYVDGIPYVDPSRSARFEIPIAKDGVLNYKNQQKFNTLAYKWDKVDRKFIGESKQDTIIESIKKRINYISYNVQNGEYGKAERSAFNAIYSSFSAAPGAGVFSNLSDDAVKHAFNGISPGQTWTRSGMIDISQAVKDALELKADSKKITAWDVQRGIEYVTRKAMGLSIADNLDLAIWNDSVRAAAYGEDSPLNQLANLIRNTHGKISAAGIKAEALRSGSLGFNDPRNLVPLGSMTSGSKEYFMSITNHMMMDADIIKQIQRRQRDGKSADIFRKVLHTRTYLDVYQEPLKHGQRAGLEANIKEMTDEAINKFYANNTKTKNGAIFGTFNDTVLVKRSFAENLYATRLNQIVLNDDMVVSDEFRKFIEEHLNDKGMLFGEDITIGGISEGKELKKIIKVGKNDVFEGFGHNDKGQLVLRYKQFVGTRDGSKILGLNGSVKATVRIEEDEIIDELTGNKNISIVKGYSDIKTTNVADKIGGRLEYIMGLENIDNIEKNKKIQKYLIDHGFEENQVFQLADDASGWIDNLSVEQAENLTDKQRLALLQLPEYLDKELNISTRGLSRTTIMKANIYDWQRTVGFGNVDDMGRNSPVKYATKEIMSIEDSIAMLKSTGESAKEYEEAIARRFDYRGKNDDSTKMIKSLILNGDAVNGTESGLSEKILDVGVDNISIDVKDGGIQNGLKNGGLAFSDVYGDEAVKGKVDEITYSRSTVGRLRQAADDAGADFVRIKLPMGVDIQGDGISKKVNSVVVPILKKNYVDGDVILSELENYTSDLFDTMNEIHHSTVLTKDLKDKLQINANKIISATGDVFDKNSQIQKEALGFRMPNAGAYIISGMNSQHYLDDAPAPKDFGNGMWQLGHKSFEQVAVINPENLREKYTIGYDVNSKEYKDAFQNLQWEYERLTGKAADSSLGEKDLIDAIVKHTDISNNIEAGTGQHVMGMANRQPSIGHDSIQHVYVRTSDKVGYGTMITTPGLEKILAADHDGDSGNLHIDSVGLRFESKEEYMKAMDQKNKIVRKQQAINQILGENIVRQEAQGDVFEDENWAKNYLKELDRISSKLGNTEAQTFIAQQARFGKNIGSISNTAYSVRQVLFDTGMLGAKSVVDEAAENMLQVRSNGLIISETMKMLEQNAISSKHLEKELADKGFISDDIVKMLQNQSQTVSAIKDGDWEKMFRLMEDRGFVEEKDGIGKVIKGANVENVLGAVKELGGDQELLDLTEKGYIPVNKAKEAFYMMSTRAGQVGKGGISWSGLMATYDFARKHIDEEDTLGLIGQAARAMDRSGGVEYSRVAQGLMADVDEGFGQAAKLTDTFTDGVERYIGSSNGGGSSFSGITRQARNYASSTADAMVDSLKGFGSKFAGIGLAVGAIWAGSAMIRPPRVDQTPAAEEEQYYDPNIASDLSAGAPMGAGPRAHLMANPQVPYQINIRGNSLNNLTNAQLSGIIESEMYNQAGLNVNFNISSSEDKKSYDRSWFDKKVAAMF